MTPYEKAQIKRSLKHASLMFVWSIISLFPIAFLCYCADLDQDEAQLVALVMAIIIAVLTTPPKIEPPGPNPRDLRP